MMKRLAMISILMLSSASLWSQGVPWQSYVVGSNGQPVPGATVKICTSSGTGTPCSPTASIFSDIPLTNPIANPITADSLGNFIFVAAPGIYLVQVSGTGVTTYSYYIALANQGSTSSVTFSATPVFVEPASLFVMTLTANVTSSSVSGPVAYTDTAFKICENSTGGWTFSWPSNFISPPVVNPTANACTNAIFSYDGTSFNYLGSADYLSPNTVAEGSITPLATGQLLGSTALPWDSEIRISNQGTVFMDALPGADLGAKWLACQALLPAGGVCDATGLTGAQVIGSNVTISTSNLTTIFSPSAVVTQSAAVAFTGASSLNPLTNVTVIGNGAHFVLANNSTWAQPANSGTDGLQGLFLWQATNVKSFTVRGVVLDGNKTNETTASYCWNLLGLYGANNFHLESNTYQNVQRHAVFVTSNTQTTPTSGVSSDGWIQDSEFSVYGNPSATSQCPTDDSGGVGFQNGVNNVALVPQNYWVLRNHFDSGYGTLDVLPQGSAEANIWFEENIIKNPVGSGTGFAQMIVEGPLNSGTTAALGHHGIHINRNHLDSSGLLGIYFAQGNQLEATGNVITNQSATGIQSYSSLGGLSNIVIADNQESGSGAVAIFVGQHTNAMAHTQVHGNITSGFTTGITVSSDSQTQNTFLQVYDNDGAGDTAAVSFPASFPAGMSTEWLSDDSGAHTLSNGTASTSLVNFGNVGTSSLGLNLGSNETITMTLTSNSGLGTISNPPAGTLVTFEITDPGAAYSFTWTTASCGGGCSWKGGMSMTGSKTNVQTFLYDGTNYVALTPGVAN